MDFTCCRTCGLAEIGDEVPPGESRHGFVFFHQQDSERLADPQATLFLAYGPMTPPQDGDDTGPWLAVGRQVAQALTAEGLRVEWDEDPDRRIEVRGLDWRRRLPA